MCTDKPPVKGVAAQDGGAVSESLAGGEAKEEARRPREAAGAARSETATPRQEAPPEEGPPPSRCRCMSSSLSSLYISVIYTYGFFFFVCMFLTLALESLIFLFPRCSFLFYMLHHKQELLLCIKESMVAMDAHFCSLRQSRRNSQPRRRKRKKRRRPKRRKSSTFTTSSSSPSPRRTTMSSTSLLRCVSSAGDRFKVIVFAISVFCR